MSSQTNRNVKTVCVLCVDKMFVAGVKSRKRKRKKTKGLIKFTNCVQNHLSVGNRSSLAKHFVPITVACDSAVGLYQAVRRRCVSCVISRKSTSMNILKRYVSACDELM
jgi:hypothetical protein